MIVFDNVSKTYEGKQSNVVSNLSFTIDKAQFACLIGPSGCGKTTTLKMINRLIEPSRGEIYVNGKNIMDQDPVKLRRSIGYVIQQIGLFPHLTIADNIAVVPKLLGWSKDAYRSRSRELLSLVGLDPDEYEKRYPRELSGGQQQRIGVLRALAGDQDIILMDEPFGALDPLIRESLQDELKQLQQILRKTIVFVTHDMDEALKLADSVVLMRDGVVVQIAKPDMLIRNPANQFVTEFIGRKRLYSEKMNLLAGDVMSSSPNHLLSDTTVDAAISRMSDSQLDRAAVVDQDSRFLGIVTLSELQGLTPTESLDALCLENPLFVTPNTPVMEVMHLMYVMKLDCMPVIHQSDGFLGVVTREVIEELFA